MSYPFQEFGDFINGSTFEADAMNYQEWPTCDEAFGALHFYQTPANIEAIPVRNQLEPQLNLPLHEIGSRVGWWDTDGASGPSQFHQTLANIEAMPFPDRLEPQSKFPLNETQPRGTGEPVITKGVQGLGGHTSTHPGVRTCAECNKEFGRIQELKRHQKDRHEPPRQCPYCRDFTWKRPAQIKAHLLADHKDRFNPETLFHIEALYGQKVVAFVDGLIADPSRHDVTSFPR